MVTAAGVAQTPAVFSSGLQFPSKIIAIPGSNLLVTEAGKPPNAGRISVIDASGTRRTLLDGLPSGLAAPNNDPDGPNGLALSGRTLYIANGEGDTHVNGPRPGSILPNPAAPSSPLYASILQATFSNDLDKITTGFSLKLQDHYTLLDGKTVTLTNSAGDTAAVQLVAAFRIDVPDPAAIYRNSHPYGLTMLPSQPDILYVADAGMNTVVQVNVRTGRSQVLTRFPNTPNPPGTMGPPASEAVPNSVQPYGDQLLVSLLSGAPFLPGTSRIMQVDPATGGATTFIAALSSAIDVLYRQKADGSYQFFVLEYSAALGAQAPGRLRVYTSPAGQVLVNGLTTPTSMALDPATGNLYIVDRSEGTVLQVNAGK